MSLLIKYESGLSSTFEDITDRVRLYTFEAGEYAEEGSVAASSITVDDPDGDYDIKGWRRVKAFETAATGSNTLIGNWFVAERTVERGPFVTGAGRHWVVNLVDQNTVLGLRILTEASANRPAETDVARITWLLSVLGTPGIPTTDYFSSSNPVAMDAVDYRGQSRLDVIDDCAQQSGKNYFVYTKDGPSIDSGLTLGLWYDFAGSTAYSSMVRLSNDLDDLAVPFTYAISEDTQLAINPARVYSGAYGRYDGGTVYDEDLQTSNEFTRRDAVVPMENVKTNAKATARNLRYLADVDVEEERITTSYLVPAAHVNYLRQGMTVEFKATHLPGYAVFNRMRVMQRTVKFNSEVEAADSYLVTVVLSQNDPPQTTLESNEPDIEFTFCNTVIVDSNRQGQHDTGINFAIGETWSYEITNSQHDPNAITDDFELNGYPGTVPGAVPDGNATGQFTTTQTGTHGAQGSADYSGNATVNECWTVKLYRIS